MSGALLFRGGPKTQEVPGEARGTPTADKRGDNYSGGQLLHQEEEAPPELRISSYPIARIGSVDPWTVPTSPTARRTV
jgi:hypothetical protein